MTKELTFLEFLTESPEFVGSTEFGLENRILNRKQLKTRLSKKVEVLQDSDDFEIFRTGDDRNGSIVLWDKETDLIGYFVAYEAKNYPHIGKFVTQVKLWRSLSSPYSKGKTTQIFFGFLLKKYGGIMSDSQQTKRGSDFWIDQMAFATTKGYSVGLANLNTKEVIWYSKKDDGPYANWISFHKDKAWGIGNKFQAMRFLISN